LEVRRGPEMLLHVGVEHALLLQVVGHCVLRQKWSLEANFGSNPFALLVGLVRRMVATPTTSELGTKVGVLDLIEVPNLPPGLITDRARDIDFKPDDGHAAPRGTRALAEKLFHNRLSLRATAQLCGYH
jgi:hypothetical protein